MWSCPPGRNASLLHASQTHANRSASNELWSHAPRSPAASHLCEATAPCANMVSRAERIAPIIDGACSLQRRGLIVPSLHCLLGVLLLLLAGLLEVLRSILTAGLGAACHSAAPQLAVGLAACYKQCKGRNPQSRHGWAGRTPKCHNNSN